MSAMLQDIAITAKKRYPKIAHTVYADALHHALVTSFQKTVDLSASLPFLVTGDIPAMWIRDSTEQVIPYLSFVKYIPHVDTFLQGVLFRQATCILNDPYANAFRNNTKTLHMPFDRTQKKKGVWERKFEMDTLLYHLRLLRLYTKAIHDLTIYTHPLLQKSINTILKTLQTEQTHTNSSSYHFHRPFVYNANKSKPVHEVGLIWSAFRPSDDPCFYNYHIPSQLMAIEELSYLERISIETVYSVKRLRDAIQKAITTYGIVHHQTFGDIYPYEVDGRGNFILLGDATPPNLLSLPLFAPSCIQENVYQNTRRFILSLQNSTYFEGSKAKGIGSTHTPSGYIWPLALSLEILTMQKKGSYAQKLLQLLSSKNTKHDYVFQHESFHRNNTRRWTRKWFGMSCAYYTHALLSMIDPSYGVPL